MNNPAFNVMVYMTLIGIQTPDLKTLSSSRIMPPFGYTKSWVGGGDPNLDEDLVMAGMSISHLALAEDWDKEDDEYWNSYLPKK